MATKGESKSKRTDSDAILRELIKKEMRIHRLSFNYMLSPSKAATLVITQKPTGDPLMMKSGETILDSEYLEYVEKRSMRPREKYEVPATTSQTYGWDTEPLINNKDRRFHFPRVASDVTKNYRNALEEKKK